MCVSGSTEAKSTGDNKTVVLKTDACSTQWVTEHTVQHISPVFWICSWWNFHLHKLSALILGEDPTCFSEPIP